MSIVPVSTIILVNAVGYVLNECKQLRKKSDVYHYTGSVQSDLKGQQPINTYEAAGHTSLSSGCVLPKACPLTGYEDWYKVGSRCVKYFGSPFNFTAAEFSCKNKAPGGHLVSVHNSKANSDLLGIVIKLNPHKLRIWIGGFEFFQSGRFIWTDGSSWNYQIWTPGEPKHIFNVGKWNDDACYVKKKLHLWLQSDDSFDSDFGPRLNFFIRLSLHENVNIKLCLKL
uniref:C-type lectin domain-containing protein n=1 Tax=Sinocyclocheilus rhinocerous TaxID=307959 RepID=A0A673NC49_9TELE